MTLGTLMAWLAINVLIGVLGYHYIAGMSWMDALQSASLMMVGMSSPATITITSNAGKIWLTVYALYAGAFFIVLFTLSLNRILMQDDEE